MSTIHNTSAANNPTTARNPGAVNDSTAATTSITTNDSSIKSLQQKAEDSLARWDVAKMQRPQHHIYQTAHDPGGVNNPAFSVRPRDYYTPLSGIPALAWKVDDILRGKLGVVAHPTGNGEYPTLYARAVAGKELRKKYWEAYDLHCTYPMFTAAIWEQMEPYDREVIQETLSGRVGRV